MHRPWAPGAGQIPPFQLTTVQLKKKPLSLESRRRHICKEGPFLDIMWLFHRYQPGSECSVPAKRGTKKQCRYVATRLAVESVTRLRSCVQLPNILRYRKKMRPPVHQGCGWSQSDFAMEHRPNLLCRYILANSVRGVPKSWDFCCTYVCTQETPESGGFYRDLYALHPLATELPGTKKSRLHLKIRKQIT
jgi:hypothetical protein